MADAKAFLQAILENPDDDSPRLIFADWLEERGDKERAEFIRVGCAKAQLAHDDPQRLMLHRREHELESQHRADWLRGLSKAAISCRPLFRRGFPESVFCTVREFLAGAPSLFATSPIDTANLRQFGSRVVWDKLARSSYLSHLRELDLSFSAIDEPSFISLIRSPHLTAVIRLKVSSAHLGDGAARALAGAGHLKRLVAVNFVGNVSDAGRQALLARFGDRVQLPPVR
jgi:uncharacterized protein (TIGR02996 family)